jgi:uncharacterized protein YdiU (UPF0061 family)
MALAHELGLPDGWLHTDDALQALSGNALLTGSEPLASVYSGHQFGVWAGQLGDGRAMLLGEMPAADGTAREIQLKGAGLTPYSRMGDGRAVLRSSIREFLCSEAMHGLGIPTTRALCVTGSDAPVRRETVETAAVVARVAPSFIRFGHFEHFSHHGLLDELDSLADFVIDRFYPECRAAAAGSDRLGGHPVAHFLEAVSERTARMVAQWQGVGFCHGVMNTDNMSILGLTIDYGPFQFMDGYNPAHICNHSDSNGRYAYGRQPNIAYWNLYALAQALLPLLGEGQAAQDLAVAALESYKTVFPAALERGFCAKLGLPGSDGTAPPSVRPVIEGILKLLAHEAVDWTIFWRRLSDWAAGAELATVRDLFIDRAAFDTWMLSYRELTNEFEYRKTSSLMHQTNPKYVLRNHLGEAAIRRAQAQDFSGVSELLQLLEHPFDEHPGLERFADFPPDWAKGIEISCSS